VHRFHGTHRLGRGGGDAGLDNSLDDGKGVSGLAEGISPSDLDPPNVDFRYRIAKAGRLQSIKI